MAGKWSDMQRKRRPTIAEIAEKAGVSIATVSRVANKTGYPVKEETRRRVEEIITQCQFRINTFGQGLSGQSNIIGVHVGVPLSVDPSFSQSAAHVIDGIKSVTRERGYHVVLNVQDATDAKSQVDLLFGIPLAGVLLMAPRNDDATISLLNEWEIPFVILGSSGFPECNYVDGDEEYAGREAVHHLVRNGRRRIAYLGSTDNYEPVLARLRGYSEALSDLSLPYRKEWVVQAPTTTQGAFAAAVRILALRERPDSIIAYNDIMAAGALEAAHELGFRVPEDFAIVGYDGSLISELIKPQITTFLHEDFAIGATGTTMLLDKVIPGVHGETPLHELLKPRLLPRASSAAQSPTT